MARAGASVAVVDINDQAGKETTAQIQVDGGNAIFIHADVTVTTDVSRMVEQVLRTLGSLSVLHNNAGIAVRQTVSNQDEHGWDECIRVNLKSVFVCSKHAVGHMLAGGGSIINTSSVTGITGVRNRAAYSASKGGIVALTKNMALDFARYRIRVNCLCPGFIRTPLVEKLLDDPHKGPALLGLHPLGRFGTPEDVANAAVFLASNQSSWITGHALVVDGGFSAGHAEDI